MMSERKVNKDKKKGPVKVVTVGSISVPIYSTPTISDGQEYASFTISYNYGDGRRRERKPSLAEAVARAEVIANSIANGSASVGSFSAEDLAIYSRIKSACESKGVTIDQVFKEWDAAHSLLGGVAVIDAVKCYARQNRGVTPRKTPEVVTELLLERKNEVSGRHYSDLSSRLNRFASSFDCPVHTITGTDIHNWLVSGRDQHGNPWSLQTRKNFRTCISNLVSFCKLHGYLPRDWSELDYVPQIEVPLAGIEVWSPAEVAKLLLHTPAEMVPTVALFHFTTVRHSEIERADWKNIDLAHGTFYLDAVKVRSAGHRFATIPPNCIEWLRPHAKQRGRICPYLEFSHEMAKIAKAAGIAWKQNAPRHSSISYTLARTKNLPSVSEESGTSVSTLTKRYRRPIRPDLVQLYFSITPSTAATVSETVCL